MTQWEWGPETLEIDEWNRECEAEYEEYISELKEKEERISLEDFIDDKIEELQKYWNDYQEDYMEERA